MEVRMGCRVVSLPMAFAAGLTAAALGTAAQSQTPPGTWTQKAPMPALRGEVAAAAVGDKLFALGGGVAGKAVPRNEEYDPASNRWRERAPLPQPRERPSRRRRAQRQNLYLRRLHLVGAPRGGRRRVRI